GVKIIAIRRRGRWFYDPQDKFQLRANDTILVIGVEDGFQHLKECAEGTKIWGED
ncbi:MAG: potassium transporter TrkA, partial [Thermoplasmata archaeon]|nr:potassium transporter TrkA [Thermoplasmata archaeon]